MARAAKKETPLTIEEKLAKALVPEDEQPYPVPENWCWVRLGTVIESVNEKTDIFDQADLKYVGLENIEKDTGKIEQQPANEIKSTKNVFREGDILYGKLRPYLNKHGIVSFSGVCSTDILVFRAKLLSSNKLVDYFFHLPNFIEYAVANSKGINLPRVSEKIVLQASFPLPPFPEQQRIVTLIESLFADLDAAKEKLQAVLDGFAERRAALLHQAFTGELTREWREKNGIRDDSWVEKKLEDCGNWSGGGTPSMNHPEYWDDGAIRWVTSKDMKAEIINDTQMHITAIGEQNSSAKLINSCAVLFVTRSGILRRTLPIAMISGKFTVNQDLKVLEPENNIDTKYLLRACQAREKRILDTCMKSGTTVESINFSALKTFVISVCSLSEQKEIVRILDDIFAKESQSKVAVESALAKIDTMKKAILATAFRGGFETNNSSDESAGELLRKVL